jgi:phospholipase D1/2
MGWTDVALAIQGPAIHDLRSFFTERWNFIFKEKYEEQRTEKYFALESPHDQAESGESGMEIQVIRSASKWSNGTRTERSIQNAYIETIRNSQHFVYIENQFFITATDDHSKPVRNRIGEAIVERIVRAHREGKTLTT